MRLFLLALSLAAQTASDSQFVAMPEIGFRHVNSRTAMKYLPEAMGGGVAMLDFDRDGLTDLFFPNGAELRAPQKDAPGPVKSGAQYHDRLYRNRGGFRFEDVTEAMGVQGRGYGMGAAVGDIDNDGYPDLLVTNLGHLILYRNVRGGRFEDITRKAGLDGANGWMTSAGFLDADNDGDLDLFVARYLDFSFEVDRECGVRSRQGRSYCHPDEYKAVSSLLFRNDGNGRFTDISKESGIAAHVGKALGVAFADFDADGLTDIAVANDSFRQFLFRNQGSMRFAEIGLAASMAYDDDGKDFAGMGIDATDIDQDGRPDLIITTLSLQRYAFFRATGKAEFAYATPESKLGALTHAYAGWGLKVFDAGNDGSMDVFFANSHVMDNIERSQPSLRYEQPPLLLRYRAGTFSSIGSGPVFARPLAARGLAAGDLDNDGCLDLAIGVNGGSPVLLRGQCGANRGLMVRLEGSKSNRDGYGSRVTLILSDGRRLTTVCHGTGSYLSAHDPRVHFGLAGAAPEAIEVHWPSGVTQRVPVAAREIVVREEPR